MELPALMRCPHCGKALASQGAQAVACPCGRSALQWQDGLWLPPDLPERGASERAVRDKEAASYLKHSKFPTQVASFRSWLQCAVVRAGSTRPVALDLGCGPGPYTQQLLAAGFDVLAIDMSAASLAVNAASCARSAGAGKVCFVQYDLNQLMLHPASVDLVLMADFMQHLGGRQQRERLLREVAMAMKPGARFYLSCFNLNIKHFLKGDVHGSFADGAIRYERLTVPNMLESLPAELQVDRTEPLNVFHAVLPDRLARSIPGAFWLARMAAISGHKVTSGDAL